MREYHERTLTPLDVSDASEAIKRLMKKNRELARLSAPFDAEIEQLEADLAEVKERRESARKELSELTAAITHGLEVFALRHRDDTGAASLKLPYGTLATRSSSALVVDDDVALVAIKAAGIDAVKESVDKAALKQYLTEHPEELIDGAKLETRITASVKEVVK